MYENNCKMYASHEAPFNNIPLNLASFLTYSFMYTQYLFIHIFPPTTTKKKTKTKKKSIIRRDLTACVYTCEDKF